MKKKFFTLLAAALFGTSAFAQVAPGSVATTFNQGGLYHVGDGTNYLYVKNDSLFLGQSETLASGLWCVKAEEPVNSTYPLFTFENKGQERFLSVDLAPFEEEGLTQYPAALNYSDINSWRFSSKYIHSLDTEANYLMSYLPGRDSVAVLSYDGDSVFVNIVPAPSAGTEPAAGDLKGTLLKANLYDAAPIVLKANDFNTLFGSRDSAERKLNYINPKITQLVESAFTDAFSADSADVDYLYLKNSNGYLRVDTAVYNNAGNPYLKFAYTKAADLESSLTPELHKFRLVYLPSVDSLIINVKEAKQPTKAEIDSNVPASDWGTITSADTDALIAAQNGTDKTYLVIQNLSQSTKDFCLTIGEMPTQLHIGLGFSGCEVAVEERTSVPSDLYTIQNEKGQYLVAPIYTDSISGPMWVTLEANVDPFQIPAYQWLVVKNKDNSDVSTLNISNREYTESVFTASSIQLKKDKPAALFNAGVNVDGFTAVPAEFKKDAHLGYKYVGEDDAAITRYVFKYLHKLAGDNNVQLGVNSNSTDSLLYVGEKTTFELHPADTVVAYGNYSNKIKDLSQLERVSYRISVKDVNSSSKLYAINRFIGIDKENRYAVIDTALNKESVFFLKANNVLDNSGEIYYALVDTSYIFTDNKNVKAGVDDNNLFLKVQSQREVRTSAFSVTESESPLYRRFNREGAVKSDSFYSKDKAADVRDTLKFFRVNEPNNYLYEDAYSVYSKGLGINFLGQKHKADFDDAERTIQLIVDTAYVGRPATATTLKDTPKPQYLLWSTLKYVDGTETWDPEDECHCEPAVVTDPYSIGRLLINATDSTQLANVGKNYFWDNQWERLIFTWAVRNAENPDIIYIVNPAEFAKVSPFTYKNLEKSKAVIRKIDLGNNNHKDVVFSFRLYENEDDIAYADQVQNFFIESESGSRLYGKQTNDRNSDGITIAPMIGGWVKIHNGVPVISRGNFEDKKINDAERFNVEVDNSGETPVDNENINAEAGIKVVAGNGNVTIYNAAGKSVAISNILGQTIANSVITSDNVTIAAPKGIVIVSVQGEEAVKAIVK